jgi:hypothetical protein
MKVFYGLNPRKDTVICYWDFYTQKKHISSNAIIWPPSGRQLYCFGGLYAVQVYFWFGNQIRDLSEDSKIILKWIKSLGYIEVGEFLAE